MNSFQAFCIAVLFFGLLVLSFFLTQLDGHLYPSTWSGFGKWFLDHLLFNK